MTTSELNTFFSNHPLKEHYFAVNETERVGTAAVAERDVMAAVSHCTVNTSEEREFLNAAIAEQTIFLILNPEYLTGCYSHTQSVGSGSESRRFTSSSSPLGQRAAALIAPLLAKAAKENETPAVDTPPANDPPSNDPVDPEEPEIELPPVIKLNRG